MKAKTTLLLLLFLQLSSFGQDIKTLKPKEVNSAFIFSKAEAELWAEAMKYYTNDPEYKSANPVTKAYLDSLDSGYGPLTQGPDCSWYCGGGPYKITASHYLDEKSRLYAPDNIHDFDLLTPWIPNTAKGVTGARINFHFEPLGPRVNTIIIYNGYTKNYDLWQKNARAKKLKLYIDNKAIAILNLQDVTGGQVFPIPPSKSNTKGKDLVITLEVMEVYKGTKYDDLAISEVNFDGLDVHCFGAGTAITLQNGSTKNIENITAGDIVRSYDVITGKEQASEVTALIESRHFKIIKLKFDETEITVTPDHPIWVKGKGWASADPQKSNRDYNHDAPIKQLSVNDEVFIPQSGTYIKLKAIQIINEPVLTYTLELKSGNSFIANGVLAKTESVKSDDIENTTAKN